MNDFNTNDAHGQGNLSDLNRNSNCDINAETKRHPFISFWS